MSLVYLGAFPPGWGGVTIKNRDLYNAICDQEIHITKIDFHEITRKHSIWVAAKLLIALLNRKNTFVIGVSARSRRRLTHCLYTINRPALKRSILVIMGGTADTDLQDDPCFLKWLSEYKVIYAETNRMAKNMRKMGLENISLYPNGRFMSEKNRSFAENEKLRTVFFSYIQPEKGTDIILDTASKMPDIEFDFYGNIEKGYETIFKEKVAAMDNVHYKGIFKGSNEEVYDVLAVYDVLLFPTKWKTEGVPGILVEAKIAGITIVASNESHNAELVGDGAEGIILADNNADCLEEALRKLRDDRSLLLKLKEGSKMSANRFYIENYIQDIVKNCAGGGKTEKLVRECVAAAIAYDLAEVAA